MNKRKFKIRKHDSSTYFQNFIEQKIDDGVDNFKCLKEYFEQERDPAFARPDSLYYYKGKNVIRQMGKLILRAEYQLFNLSSDKQKYKSLIQSNKEMKKKASIKNSGH